MHVLHVPFGYFPSPHGGTEIYVRALVEGLARQGIACVVAAPGDDDRRYVYEGVPVWRFRAQGEVGDIVSLYGAGDPVAAEGFVRVLDEVRPDLVHFHAHSPAVSLRVVEEVRRRGIPIIQTYHTPTLSCQRGTLLRWGTEICDGRVEARRCAACALHAGGVPRGFASLLSVGPAELFSSISGPRRGGWRTALRMPQLVRQRAESFHSLVRSVDRIVVLCKWSGDLLERNGAPPEKIFQSRQRLPGKLPARRKEVLSWRPGEPLPLVWLGRLDPTKGLQVVVEALARYPTLNVRLDAYAISQNDSVWENNLRERVAVDPRIRLLPPRPAGEILQVLRGYAMTLVPSQWLETGPLVVLESFAAGRPVLGSRLGGIEELVTDGVDGMLVQHDDPHSWGRVLKELVESPARLELLRAGVKEPETMVKSAGEMATLYEEMLGGVASSLRPSND